MSEPDYPMAVPAPASDLTTIDARLLSELNAASRRSPRKRIIQPLHKGSAEPLQRMLNSLQPGTYIRPHRHASDRAESLVVLSGAICYFTFDGDGGVAECIRLAAGAERVGIDTAGGIYHSFAALEPDTVLFEVKPGPYDPQTDKEFAPWAPEEGGAKAESYLKAIMERMG